MSVTKFGRIQNRENHLTIQLFQKIPEEGIKDLQSFGNTCLKKPKHTIFSLAGIDSIEESVLATLLKFQTNLTNAEASFHLTHCSEKVRGQLLGANADFQFHASLLDSLNGIQIQEEDTSFIAAFVRSTVKTLKVQINVKSRRKGIKVDSEMNGKLPGDVSGLIWVNAPDPVTQYGVILSFPTNTFLALMTKFLGERIVEVTNEVADGATELTNIIFGISKKSINKKGTHFQPMLPILVRGNNLLNFQNPKLNPLKAQLTTFRSVEIQFESDCGPFSIVSIFHPDFNSKDLRKSD